MANLVMGAMSSIIPKLGELLKEEYDLQSSVKGRIKSLTLELELAQATLCKVAEVPWDQLDKQVQIWTRKVREASYDMEDVLDTFLMHVKGPDSTEEKQSLEKYLKKVTIFFKKSKARRKISGDVKDIMSHLQEVTEQCRRYTVHDIVAMPATPSTVDPRLDAMYTQVNMLVGMDKSSGELMSMLQSNPQRGDVSTKMKIVSIFGVGGLGKTTLAKVVYDKIKGDFDCAAFVPVGRNPDLKKILMDILIDLDKQKYLYIRAAGLDERQLIDELRNFLENKKRYIIVIDDLWEERSWEILRLAIAGDKSCEGRLIITTRKWEVAKNADEVYNLTPLPYDSSIKLFCTRIYGDETKYKDYKPDEVTINKFLKKGDGLPLAIITMASLLAGKPREKWDEIYRSIGFGSEGNKQAENTMRIVSFSYYDLPAHLRTCMLYLSAFPEDSVIQKDSLVWRWVAEGFVEKKQGKRLFETGEGYFHDLINRSMLEAVKSRKDDSIITGCRVHDMVLDFIRSMSHQENFFSVVLGSDQGTLLESNNVPRRLAHHDRTLGHGRGQGDDLKVEKVRSMFAIGCGIESSDPFHGFRLLRVLVIDNCRANKKGSLVFRNEHVRHLVHLRFLAIRRTYVERIPEEIGRLRFLQTLELEDLFPNEYPSLGILPEQLVRLWLSYSMTDHNYSKRLFETGEGYFHDLITRLTRLTSLEELSLSISGKVSWCFPTELRVLELYISHKTEATERDFWECVRHLNKLKHLTILGFLSVATVSVLPSSLRHLVVNGSIWEGCKLPSCVDASSLPNLSHLELVLGELDEHDLKMLGILPELCFLGLKLLASAKVSSIVVISDKDTAEIYFPRLRCFQLDGAMVSCYANEEDKSISFHVWAGGRRPTYLTMPSVSVDESQGPTISCSTGSGGASTNATGGAALCNRFMPCLQVLHFLQWGPIRWDNSYDNLGLEYGFPSLREIGVRNGNALIMQAARRSAKAHPNHPRFRNLMFS